MVLSETTYTPDEFETFIRQPEHGDTHFELIEGRIYPVVSSNRSSRIALFLGAKIVAFVHDRQLGWVTGADGGYLVAGQRLIPDVAFVSNTRQPEPSDAAYNPVSPDLAVEVLSPSDVAATVRLKISKYMQAGTTVWLIDPATESIEIYTPEPDSYQLSNQDTLTGGAVLPGFELPVADLFD